MKPIKFYYESPQDVPSPYHFEATIECDFLSSNEVSVIAQIQYIDREDFSKEDLIAEGLQPDNQWDWKGVLPMVWKQILEKQISKYKPGEASPKAYEPFIGLQLKDGSFLKPLAKLEQEDLFLQELLQAIFELAEREMPLDLGFQFKNNANEWILVEGELSFSQRSFRYILNGNKSNILQADFDAIKSLMNDLYIGEFSSEKAIEKLTHQNCFAVFPGDGWWYVAGNSWKKPNGNQQYFATLEDQLKNIFS